MKTRILTCAATWSAISIMPFPKKRPITSTLWKGRTTCPLTSNRQSWAVRFRYRSETGSYDSAPGRESIFASIAITAARDGWWRLCTGREEVDLYCHIPGPIRNENAATRGKNGTRGIIQMNLKTRNTRKKRNTRNDSDEFRVFRFFRVFRVFNRLFLSLFRFYFSAPTFKCELIRAEW